LKGIWIVLVIASILILGSIGLSQPIFAGGAPDVVTIDSPQPNQIFDTSTPDFVFSVTSDFPVTRIFARVGDGFEINTNTITIFDETFPGSVGTINFAITSPEPISDGPHTFAVFVDSTVGVIDVAVGFSVEADADDDGLTNDQEVQLGTDPNNPDTDLDGLTDGDEVNIYGTDPLDVDTDDDGLSDGQEIFSFLTNPTNPDTDGDGIHDLLDVDPFRLTFSNDFSDEQFGGTTFGTIIDRGDQILTISNEPVPDGVKIKADLAGGANEATIEACGGISTLFVGAGDEVIFTPSGTGSLDMVRI